MKKPGVFAAAGLDQLEQLGTVSGSAPGVLQGSSAGSSAPVAVALAACSVVHSLPEQLCASGSAPGFLYQIPGAALRGIASGIRAEILGRFQLLTVAGDLLRDQSAGLSGSVLLPSVCCRFCKNLSSWLSEILTRPTR